MAGENEAVVRTFGLTKVFRDFWLRERVTAVRELDLTIHAGEVYGLLGPNGSGKSTTLKMILGLMFPTRGRVTVFGRPPTDVKAKGRIGFLPEETYLYPFLDAKETLDYYGRLFHQPRPERRRRIEMLLDMVGLTGAAYRRIGEYSKGMQRRIGMAQALINDPDLLHQLSRRGKTVILSSHLLADMEDVCDRVGILYAGGLRAEGTLEELLSRSNLTQITTEQLDGATTDRIRRALTEADKKLVGIEAPKDKLESLFLRIVREARQRRERFAGAVETGEVAEFLRARPDQTGAGLIEELLAKPEEPQPPAEAAAATPPEPAGDVLQDLLAQSEESAPDAPAPAPPAEPAKPAPAAPSGEKADQGVIDSLIQKDEPEKPQDA
jgi:ABC-2 type transport system ATP-binding protein